MIMGGGGGYINVHGNKVFATSHFVSPEGGQSDRVMLHTVVIVNEFGF